jgi:hypothetical protein
MASSLQFWKELKGDFLGSSAQIRENLRRRFRSHRTSKLTAAPATTFCPATGTCDTMMLAGEGCAGGAVGAGGATGVAAGLAASAGTTTGAATLTFPNRNPASCSVRFALPSGCPTKLGITYACGSAGVVTSKLILGANT